MSGTTAPPQVLYESSVTAVGAQVATFLDHGMLIFFSDQAPAELHDMSVQHHARIAEAGPRAGDTIVLGELSLEVLAVGPVVEDNLLKLGHLDLKANGLREAKLPGDVNVEVRALPLLRKGDTFGVVRGTGATTDDDPDTKETP